MEIKDVTNDVEFGFSDDEYLPIHKCVCGAEFKPWSFIVSIYDDTPKQCPKCGRKFYFRPFIKVFQVTD